MITKRNSRNTYRLIMRKAEETNYELWNAKAELISDGMGHVELYQGAFCGYDEIYEVGQAESFFTPKMNATIFLN